MILSIFTDRRAILIYLKDIIDRTNLDNEVYFIL